MGREHLLARTRACPGSRNGHISGRARTVVVRHNPAVVDTDDTVGKPEDAGVVADNHHGS